MRIFLIIDMDGRANEIRADKVIYLENFALFNLIEEINQKDKLSSIVNLNNIACVIEKLAE